MASIRKRGNSYLIVVSMGYDCAGNRLKSMQQTVHPPAGMTPKQTEKWLNEQAVLFELSCKQQPQQTASNMTLAEYSKYWFENIAPNKLASSTVAREKSDIDRFLPHIGHYKLTELRPEHFRKLYVALRKEKNMINGKPLSELTVEGVHACLCGILSDAVESGLLDHNPAWRTYKYSNIDKKQQVVADEEILQKLICALDKESIKYETYFKLIIATGIRRGECCGIKWSDIDYAGRSIHICRNVVKVSGEDICIKEPKTKAGNRYVYFSPEMGTLLKEYRRYCETEALHYEGRTITDNDFLFRKHELDEPMTPTTFTWRFKLILKKNDLPYNLNVHSLRHPYVKHTTKIFSLRLMDFQAQAYPDARRKTRGACQLLRVGQSRSPVRPLCNRKRFSCLPPQSKMSWILYAISMRLSGYTSTRSISSSASSVVSVSASKIALDASFRLSCRACSSCFCFACANTAA